MSLIESPCACGNTLYDLLNKDTYDRGLESGYAFSLYKCQKCSLVRTDPVPGVSLYTDGYSHSTDSSGQYSPQDKSSNVPLALYLKKLVGDSEQLAREPVLDVGCNGGELVELLNKQGFNAEGCDVDPIAVQYGTSRGLKLFCQDLSFHQPENQYGMVTLIHTLEHVVPVSDFLMNINAALLPGGLLHVRVPNFGGWIPQLMKQSWGYLMPSLHVWEFTPETLKSCVERVTSLKLAEVKCNTTLEPKTGGVKGLMKSAVMASAAQLGQGDEIIATFKKQ